MTNEREQESLKALSGVLRAEDDASTVAELRATLAERDRRIAALEGRQFPKAPTCSGWPPCGDWNCERCAEMYEQRKRETQAAPPAPAPGELAEAIAGVDKYIAATCSNEGHHVWDAWEATQRAAESWQRLQWRPASEAPCSDTEWLLLDVAEGPTRGLHAADGRWFDVYGEEYTAEQIFGFIPLDVLPALNGGDDNG